MMNPEMIARNCVALFLHLDKCEQYKNLSLDEKYIVLKASVGLLENSMTHGMVLQAAKTTMDAIANSMNKK